MVSLFSARRARQRAARAMAVGNIKKLETELANLGVDICELRREYRLSAVPEGMRPQVCSLAEHNEEHGFSATTSGINDAVATNAVEKTEVEVVGASYFYIGDDDVSNAEEAEELAIKLDEAETKAQDLAARLDETDSKEKDLVLKLNETDHARQDQLDEARAQLAAGAAEHWKEVERIEAMFGYPMFGYPPRRGRKWVRRKKKIDKKYSVETLD